MADLMDQAQAAETLDRAAAISAARAPLPGMQSGPNYRDGKPRCHECDEIIPATRLKAIPNVGLCVTCAAEAQQGRG